MYKCLQIARLKQQNPWELLLSLLGEHNNEILSKMGYTEEEIHKLEDNGIIGKS